MGFAEQIAARAAAKAKKQESLDKSYETQSSKPTEVPKSLGLIPFEAECRDDNDVYENQVEVVNSRQHNDNNDMNNNYCLSNKSQFVEQLKLRKKLISTSPASPPSSSKKVNNDFILPLVDKKISEEVNLSPMDAANKVDGETTQLTRVAQKLTPTENKPKQFIDTTSNSSSSCRSMLESSCDVSTIKWLASQTKPATKQRNCSKQRAEHNEQHLSPAADIILKQLEEKNEQQQCIAAQSIEERSSSIQQSTSQVVADRKYQFRRLKAQIGELTRRLKDAEEHVIQERQRADAVAFENRLLKQVVSWGDDSMDDVKTSIRHSCSMPSRHLRY